MFAEVAKKETNIGLRLSDDLKKRLTKLAEANKRTLSDYIRLMLEEIADEKEKSTKEKPQ